MIANADVVFRSADGSFGFPVGGLGGVADCVLQFCDEDMDIVALIPLDRGVAEQLGRILSKAYPPKREVRR